LAVKELGVRAIALAKKLLLSQSTGSISVKRGEKIVTEKGFDLWEK